MTTTPRIIYPPQHHKSARARQERKDRIEALICAGVILALMAIILQFSFYLM